MTSAEIEVVSTALPGFVTAEERGYIAALDTTITPELREEGMIRDLIHFVQDMRKKAGLNIEDHIGLALYTSTELAHVLHGYQETLMSETLAGNMLLSISENDKPSFAELYRERISPDPRRNWRTTPSKLSSAKCRLLIEQFFLRNGGRVRCQEEYREKYHPQSKRFTQQRIQ